MDVRVISVSTGWGGGQISILSHFPRMLHTQRWKRKRENGAEIEREMKQREGENEGIVRGNEGRE